MATPLETRIEHQLAEMANDWRRYFGKSEAEIADLVKFNRARLTAMAEDDALWATAARFPLGALPPINELSTLNHAQQGTGRGR